MDIGSTPVYGTNEKEGRAGFDSRSCDIDSEVLCLNWAIPLVDARMDQLVESARHQPMHGGQVEKSPFVNISGCSAVW